MLIELTRGKYTIIDMSDADLAGKSLHPVPGHYITPTIDPADHKHNFVWTERHNEGENEKHGKE